MESAYDAGGIIAPVVLRLIDGREWPMRCTFGALLRFERRCGPETFSGIAGGRALSLEAIAALLYEAGPRTVSYDEFIDLLPAPGRVLGVVGDLLEAGGLTAQPGGAPDARPTEAASTAG